MENINEKINKLNEFFRSVKERDDQIIKSWLSKLSEH